jgi:hypothetical protein
MATTTSSRKQDTTASGSNGDDTRDVGGAVLEAAGVDEDSLRKLLDEGERLLRERPAVALGGALAVGLVLGRLWKLHLMRVGLPMVAFAAGFAADRLVGQSEETVRTT